MRYWYRIEKYEIALAKAAGLAVLEECDTEDGYRTSWAFGTREELAALDPQDDAALDYPDDLDGFEFD